MQIKWLDQPFIASVSKWLGKICKVHGFGHRAP